MAFAPAVAWALHCVLLAAPAPAPAAPAIPCAARERLPDHLRPQNCSLALAIVSGLERSTEFRRLVDRIAELNGSVFIQPGTLVQPTENRILMGALLHRVTLMGGQRALFIIVRPDRDDDTLITLAHEFQHVVEVLESNASTEQDIDALFVRIGASAGANTRETGEAVLVGHRVARELAHTR